jgi:hypothetical protein
MPAEDFNLVSGQPGTHGAAGNVATGNAKAPFLQQQGETRHADAAYTDKVHMPAARLHSTVDVVVHIHHTFRAAGHRCIPRPGTSVQLLLTGPILPLVHSFSIS